MILDEEGRGPDPHRGRRGLRRRPPAAGQAPRLAPAGVPFNTSWRSPACRPWPSAVAILPILASRAFNTSWRLHCARPLLSDQRAAATQVCLTSSRFQPFAADTQYSMCWPEPACMCPGDYMARMAITWPSTSSASCAAKGDICIRRTCSWTPGLEAFSGRARVLSRGAAHPCLLVSQWSRPETRSRPLPPDGRLV